LNCKFDELSRLTRVFFNWICFLNFILKLCVHLKLGFIFYLGLFSMRLFSSQYLGHEFGGLALVDSNHFLCPSLNQFFFQFHLSTLSWLRNKFRNFFKFSFYWVILVSWPQLWVYKFIQVNSGNCYWSFLLIFFNFII